MLIKTFKKLHANFFNSLAGLKVALREHSFVLELSGGVVLILPLLFTSVNFTLKAALVAAYLLLLATEILNTAIEKLCNKFTRDYDEAIRDIKDLASAAVFLTLLITASVWLAVVYMLFLTY